MGIPDHFIFLQRNLYAGQVETVRTGHGRADLFQIGKGVHQGYILSPCLFNFYAEYITQNARLDEAQARIKTAGRNTNNIKNADDITPMPGSKEELKYLLMILELMSLMKKESEKDGLKFNIQITKI